MRIPSSTSSHLFSPLRLVANADEVVRQLLSDTRSFSGLDRFGVVSNQDALFSPDADDTLLALQFPQHISTHQSIHLEP